MNKEGLNNLLTCINCPEQGLCGIDRISDCVIIKGTQKHQSSSVFEVGNVSTILNNN